MPPQDSKSIEEALRKVEEATSKFVNLEKIFQELGEDVKNTGFSSCAVQLVRSQEHIIENVYGTGDFSEHQGFSKHYLHEDQDWRDIQADIALNKEGQVEIISGWDKRFDQGIFNKFHHDNFTRIFIPIAIGLDNNENVLNKWPADAVWKKFPLSPDEETSYDPVTKQKGERRKLILRRGSTIDKLEIIGTLEVKLNEDNVDLQDETIHELTSIAAKYAYPLYETTLSHALRVIAQNAIKFADADSASIHFLQKRGGAYHYNVVAGNFNLSWLNDYPPRDGIGLGAKALQANYPQWIPNYEKGHTWDQLKEENPGVWGKGVRAKIAFPIKFTEKSGVLYVHFHHRHDSLKEVVEQIHFFANRITEAIRHSISLAFEKDTKKQLKTLHFVTQSLSSMETDPLLLDQFVGATLNLLCADVVSLYEYKVANNTFQRNPFLAGRLTHREKMVSGIKPSDSPVKLMQKFHSDSEPYCSTDPTNDKILSPSRPTKDLSLNNSFVKREGISSVIVLPIKFGTEFLGILFINFRRYKQPTVQEIDFLKSLASSAGIAIKNHRLFEIFNDIESEILKGRDHGTLGNVVLNHIGSIFGGQVKSQFYIFDSILDRYLLKAEFPEDTLAAEEADQIDQEKARKLNIKDDTFLFPGEAGFFFYLGLFNQFGRKLGLISICGQDCELLLTNEWALKAIAKHAAIGIGFSKNQEKLAASETLAVLGNFAGNFLHRSDNFLGGLKEECESILSLAGDHRINEHVENINKIHENYLGKLKSLLEQWVVETKTRPFEVLYLDEALKTAIAKFNLSNVARIEIQFIPPQNDVTEVNGHLENVLAVFAIVLENAIEAIQERNEPGFGKIMVSLNEEIIDDEKFVIVGIKDNGTGIPEHIIPNIFTLHWTTKKDQKLLRGFGLWWVKTYMEERLHGRIRVNTIPGEGSEFLLYFPAIHSSPQNQKS